MIYQYYYRVLPSEQILFCPHGILRESIILPEKKQIRMESAI